MTTAEIVSIVCAIVSTLATMVTAIIAIVAVYQTKKQIEISNKQQLFDRRLKKYLFTNELLNLYNDSKTILDDECFYLPSSLESAFTYLTNSSKLESMVNVLNHYDDFETKKEFLTKCEMIEQISNEIEFLWNDEEIKKVSQFVLLYKKLLMNMYKQKIFLDKEGQSVKEYIEKPIPQEIYRKKVSIRAETLKLFDINKELKMLYQDIEEKNILNKMKESIKLN